MRNKVRKSLAFLLALALVVSVMSGLGLSVSAEQESNTPGTEEVQQQDKTEAGAAPSEVNAEEEAAKPKEKPVQEEKKDEQKKQEETKTDDANAQDGDQKDEPQAEPAEEEQDAPVEQASVPIVQAAAGEVSQYTITCGNQSLTVKLVDDSDKPVNGTAPSNTTVAKDEWKNIAEFAASVTGYTYSEAKYKGTSFLGDYEKNIKQIQYKMGYYSASWRGRNGDSGSGSEIENNTIYLVYTKSTFTIHYVDENGTEIKPSTERERAQSVTFSDYADPISGYTYWRACYSKANDAEVTKAEKNNSGSTYTFYNGSKKLSRPNNSSLNTEAISKLNDIYLVYVKDGGDPTPGGTTGGSGTATATNTKTATRNDDGTYDLSLTASGSVGTSENKAILDVIYVLDCSGSMEESMGWSGSRISAAKDAITTMTNSLASNNKINARFSLVTFSYSANTQQEWTTSTDTLTNAMNGISVGGATNYEGALTQAKSLLGSARINASKVVVFVSDGIPTAYTSTGEYGGGDNDSDGRAMSRARGVVKTMTPNYLFTVGVGPEKNYSNLSEVTGAAHSGVKIANYAGTDSDKLKAAFAEMEGTITSVACEDVTINDTLSKNVEMVMENGAPKKLVGTVTGAKDGDVTNNADGTITLAATALNEATTLPAPTYSAGKIQWKFPAGYKLEADYTYTVTAKISVTEEAYQNYRNNGNRYPDQADEETGTHAGKMDLYSNVNTEATLIYKQTGKSEYTSVNYAKPVVQLNPGSLVIEKKFEGLTDAQIESLKNTLTFQYTLNDGEAKSVKLGGMTYSNGSYRATVETGLSPNTTYTVTESGTEVENYDVDTKTENVTGTVNKGATAVASFTNTYTPSNRTITLKKVVTGNMGDKNQSFTFSATKATLGETSLKDSGTTTITAKVGETVTITEDDYTSDGYTTTAEGVTGGTYNENTHSYTFTVTKDMSESTIITFTNTKTIQPPNGITTTIAPYAIMVVLAAGAGVYFVYSRRRRNR